MKIIKNNYNKEKEIITFECTCPNCTSIVEFDENDIKYDEEYNEKYVICPCCDVSITDKYFDKNVTLDNISYPSDFYQYGNHDFGLNLSDEEINKRIKKCIDFLKFNPNMDYKCIGSGDTFIIVFNHDDEYYFVVAKNYADASVSKT